MLMLIPHCFTYGTRTGILYCMATHVSATISSVRIKSESECVCVGSTVPYNLRVGIYVLHVLRYEYLYSYQYQYN